MSENMAAILAILLTLNLITVLVVIIVRGVRQNRQRKLAAEVQAMPLPESVVKEENTVTRQLGAFGQQLTAVERKQVANAIMAMTATLREIVNGNHDARVALSVDLTLPLSDELNELTYYLNTTLERLTHAIVLAETRSEHAQDVQQSWAAYAQESRMPTGYRYEKSEGVSADDHVWVPSMAAATQTREPVQQEGVLSIPLTLGNDVIGAMALQRDASQPWSAEELLLIQDVVDQLSQTIDRLRLVDDVSRRAALEQTTGTVTASIRSEVEIEGVLQRALAELGQALQAETGTVYLSMETQQETVQ